MKMKRKIFQKVKNLFPVGKAGFTVLELLITTSLSSVVLGTLFLAMQTGQIQLESSDARMTMQDSAREGIHKMVQEIRQSAPTRITITNGSAIQFTIPDAATPLNSSYSVNWSNGDVIQYALGGTNNQQVIRTNSSAGTTKVIANDVTALSFVGNSGSPTVVTITMSVQRTLKNGRLLPAAALQLTGQAEVRNT